MVAASGGDGIFCIAIAAIPFLPKLSLCAWRQICQTTSLNSYIIN